MDYGGGGWGGDGSGFPAGGDSAAPRDDEFDFGDFNVGEKHFGVDSEDVGGDGVGGGVGRGGGAGALDVEDSGVGEGALSATNDGGGLDLHTATFAKSGPSGPSGPSLPTNAGVVGKKAVSSEQARRETVQALLECIEIAIHQILFFRKVYPAELFHVQRRFNVAVHMSRHPELNDFVFKVLRNAQGYAERGEVESLELIIMGPAGGVVERFSFDMSTRDDPVAMTYGQLEEACGALLTKLSMLDASMPPAKRDTTFNILVHTHEVAPRGVSEAKFVDHVRARSRKHEWQPVAPGDPELDAGGSRRRPLKTLRAGHVDLQLFSSAS